MVQVHPNTTLLFRHNHLYRTFPQNFWIKSYVRSNTNIRLKSLENSRPKLTYYGLCISYTKTYGKDITNFLIGGGRENRYCKRIWFPSPWTCHCGLNSVSGRLPTKIVGKGELHLIFKRGKKEKEERKKRG